MAAAGKLNLSDQVITGRIFRGENLSKASFRRATLADCSFLDCDLRAADFRNARLVRCILDGCRIETPNFDGAVIEDCNFEVLDGRIAGRGYMVVATLAGLQIGCASFSWALARNMPQRELLKMDKRNAVMWWERFGPRVLEIGERRQWA